MSFRARAQAYRAWEADEFAKPGDKIPFLAGWDAAKADMPDRVDMARLILSIDHHPEVAKGDEADNARPWQVALKTADAILSLLRGETKP